MLDPAFHTLSEEERKAAERIATEDFRKGSEVKFSLGNKKPVHHNYRFWELKIILDHQTPLLFKTALIQILGLDYQEGVIICSIFSTIWATLTLH